MKSAELIIIADWLLKIAVGLRVVMRGRPVPISLAWLAVLLIPVPFIGVVLYAIIGEIRLGGRRLKRYKKLTEGIATKATVLWRARNHQWDAETEQYKHIAVVAAHAGGIPPLRGNEVKLYSGAAPFIEALLEDIDNAKTTIHLLFYIFIDHGTGLRVVKALERAAARGVTCRVLVDGVGSHKLLRGPIPERLRKAGVKFAVALPVNPLRLLFARLDLRNHRKVAVFDGWTAYTGSQNVMELTFKRRSRVRKGPYIDAMARVVGPAAQALEVIFLRDWEVETEEGVTGKLEEFLPVREVPKEGSIIQVVPSGPDEPPESMREALLTTIYAARRELIITTPYFVPDEASKQALLAAAMRGVEVTLVVPDEHDSIMVAAAARAHFLDLLLGGVRIKFHTKGLLHSKTVTVDGAIGLIGSANFDTRSFGLNFEVTLFIYDSDLASLLRMLQMGYLADSVDVHVDEWKCRSAWRCAIDNAVKLLGPLF